DVAPADLAITVRGDRLPLAALAAIAPRGFELSRTRASGVVVVRRRGAGATLAVDGSIEQLAIDHPNLAISTVVVDGTLRGELAISADAIAVPHAELGIGAARFTASGWVRRSAPVSGQLDVTLASAPCADLLLAMPQALRGPLDGMTLGGNLGASMRLAIDLAAPPGDGASLASAFTGACTVSAEPPEADVTTLVRAGEQQLADGSRMRIDPDNDQYISLRRLPYYVQAAFVSAEDGRFWNHPGFDLVQIARSLEIDLRERRLARGGSTISQQLVKNAFLSQRRSLDRKIQEAILTWRLESRLEKTEILERYLNIIELGPRVFGLRAAARYWFGASPRDLTVRQAAFLAALTSQPTSMSRRVRKARGLDPQTAERVAIVLGAMKRDGVITSETYDYARHSSMHFASTAVSPEP
nr:transglycosylase domain-containing protein [Myxococcota bacterium]